MSKSLLDIINKKLQGLNESENVSLKIKAESEDDKEKIVAALKKEMTDWLTAYFQKYPLRFSVPKKEAAQVQFPRTEPKEQRALFQHLEAELMREQAKWDEMKVPDRLKTALTRFGLEMDVPREDQLVRMSNAGAPVPGQLALKRLRGLPPAGTTVARAGAPRRSASSSVLRRQQRNGVRK